MHFVQTSPLRDFSWVPVPSALLSLSLCSWFLSSGSSYVLPSPVLESAISLRSLDLLMRVVLLIETKLWALGVVSAAGLLLPPGLVN